MARKYNPQVIEPKWQKCWDDPPDPPEADAADSSPSDSEGGKKFYALVEFPYPSGSGLHIGHAFTMTILDIFARKKRMEGLNVLYPMGWDAFGLPTENYAIRTGIHPAEATKRNTDQFRRQMKRLAFAYNWEREVNTTDPDYYRWTQWIFTQLFREGLAYKAEMPVGWCPACKIVLANEEIVDGKCERCGHEAERRMQSQWLLRITKYADRLADELDLVDFPDYVKTAQRNWIGRTEGIEIDYPVVGSDVVISCYSTRPDTNFGATFVVIAPEHPIVASLSSKAVEKYVGQVKKKSERERITEGKEKTGVFTGLYCINQLNGRKMPIWVSDFVVSTAGTGAVVGVPAHDERDHAFAKKYDLEIVPVVRPKGPPAGGWDYEKGAFIEIDEAEVFNSDFLDGLSVVEAQARIIDYLVEKGWGRRKTNYHLRDWVFSRQHYWGEPIPMIYCSKCGWRPVPEGELPVKLPKVERYQPTDTGESPLANIKEWVEVACPECGSAARRETDTMPNWAGSSWYFLAYAFSHKLGTQKSKENVFLKYRDAVNYWMPVDLYLGGAEHTTLHLLYSRFWHKALNDLGIVPGKEPYKVRRQHGVILGEDGFKMSKSRGNVINPEEVVEKFGADTLRVYLMFMGPYEQTLPWSSKGVVGIWRFLNRVWRLADRIGDCHLGDGGYEDLERLVHQTIKKVGEDIEELKYNTAIAAMMTLVNDLTACQSVPREALEYLVLLLAPFAPFLAEELYQRLCSGSTKYQVPSTKNLEFSSVHSQPWPEYNPELVKEEMVTVVVQINGKVRGKLTLEVRGSRFEAEVEKLALESPKVQKHLQGKKIKKTIFVPGKLINFVV